MSHVEVEAMKKLHTVTMAAIVVASLLLAIQNISLSSRVAELEDSVESLEIVADSTTATLTSHRNLIMMRR